MKKIFFLLLILMNSCQDYPEYEASDTEGESCTITGIDFLCPDFFNAGTLKEIKTIALFSDGTRSIVEPEYIMWESVNPDVARFDSPGLLFSVSEGTCCIKAEYLNFAISRDINVIDPFKIGFQEILYDAAGSDTGREFIVLRNRSASTADISGFRITDGTAACKELVFPGNTVILSGKTVSICSDSDVFYDTYGVIADLEGLSFTLNNSGETLFLFSRDNEMIGIIYIEGGSAEFPEPYGYGFPGLSSPEGYSLNYDYDADIWFSALPVNSLK
ncbi:MAG: lamin tail domain-containing protein [Spirochaetes bacterium]|nr:lamin tail domain-containing protein [Spirochaetota bacterium]